MTTLSFSVSQDGEDIGRALSELMSHDDITQFIIDILDIQHYSIKEKVMNHLKEQIEEFIGWRENEDCPTCVYDTTCTEKDKLNCSMHVVR